MSHKKQTLVWSDKIAQLAFLSISFASNSSHSLLTELLVAGYSVLGDVYKMVMLKIRPQKCHYHTQDNTCYFMDRNPAAKRKFVQQDSGWQPVIPSTDCEVFNLKVFRSQYMQYEMLPMVKVTDVRSDIMYSQYPQAAGDRQKESQDDRNYTRAICKSKSNLLIFYGLNSKLIQNNP